MNKPHISLCIPTFNRAVLLQKTLESVARQTVLPHEVIVVDNASTDNTSQVVKRYEKYKFRYIQNKTNIGMAGNFNQCIAAATGDYLAFLHSDDLIAPTWHEEFLKAIATKRADIYTSSLCTIDETEKLGFVFRTFKKHVFIPKKNVLVALTKHYHPILPPTGSTVYKKQVFDRFGKFDPAHGTEYDVVFSMYSLSRYSLYYVDSILFAYRTHPEQTFEFQQQQKNTDRRLLKLKSHFQLLKDYVEKEKTIPMNREELIIYNVWMSLCSNNLYIIYGDVKRVFGALVIAHSIFPFLFHRPKSVVIFIKIQVMFIIRVLVKPFYIWFYQSKLPWLKGYTNLSSVTRR